MARLPSEQEVRRYSFQVGGFIGVGEMQLPTVDLVRVLPRALVLTILDIAACPWIVLIRDPCPLLAAT